MKQLTTLVAPYQQKLFYFFLILLFLGGAVMPALAQTLSASYQPFIEQATRALDKGDTRAAYQAFARARKQARKHQDQAHQDAFRDCLRKIPFYENYTPLIEQAAHQLQEENYKNAQESLLAAREQLYQLIAIPVDVPAITQYEADRRQALDDRIRETEAKRLLLLEQALAMGEDLLLQERSGEALDFFYQASNLALDQQDENRRYRIGERILKAKIHYDVYTQLNLARREAGYRRYPEAQRIFQDALAKMEQSREYYFSRLEKLDNEKQWEVQEMLDEVNAKRIKTYEQALRRGQDYLEQDQLEDARQAFVYAHQQMFEAKKEPQTTGVTNLLAQTEYRILVQQGDAQMQQGQYRESILAYEEAQKHMQTADLPGKITQAKSAGYQQALAKGQQAFVQGQYQLARDYYDLAATFQDTPELKNRLEQHYQTLVLEGQQEKGSAAYDQARLYYENARLFADKPEVKELVGEVQGGMDYEVAYTTGMQQLREGRIEDARKSFEQARTHRNSVEVQDQLFSIQDYQLALSDGRRAVEKDDPDRARVYFQKARDIFSTTEVNDWLRRTGAQTEADRLAVQSYDAQSVFASSRSLRPKGIGAGRIDFNFSTVLWMRPDCRLDWSIELFNNLGTLVNTTHVDDDCRFTFSNLPDGTYTYRLKLQDGGRIAIYRTESDAITIRNGETATVEIDAVGKN